MGFAGKIMSGKCIFQTPARKGAAEYGFLVCGNAVQRYYRPSPEEAREWGSSFDKLMHSKAGRQLFKAFLRSEYSEENMLFWIACEELKYETVPDVVEEKARTIYDDYISILSPKEVSLDAQVRELINRKMVNPSCHTFDEAQVQIYTLMQRDSYPRFLNSPMFKRLLSNQHQQPQNPS